MGEKVVLAYSGGLDTSVILKWLCSSGHDVTAYIADVGQAQDFSAAREKALAIGASSVFVDDLKEEFVGNYVFKALKANCMYEGSYLLGTSLARPVIAKGQVEFARKEGANVLAHGATGKGNDQVRFELAYLSLMPGAEIISPWKDAKFLEAFNGRSDMIKYAEKHGIPVQATVQKPYSTDENLMHTSYESGILEDAGAAPGNDMFVKTASPQKAPDKEEKISVEFKTGIPVKAANLGSGSLAQGGVQIMEFLNSLGGACGIGRVDMVENRFVGIKSRGVYESPGAAILWKAHRDIEGLTLDREVSHLKDTLMPKISELIYNGFWFSPEMDFLMSAVEQSQKHVTGEVFMTLYKGNAIVTGRKSKEALYSPLLSSMDSHGGFNQQDSKGFIRVNAVRLQASAKRDLQ
ncbi:MAG: argininosuccinate synthase [Candidatus Diapherotrites archaeon]|uniref:Argininosuccinate synthase n=1 Tax=Candidatus Iainarchaeum sp. TaxID=3101447 RepID=A0A8T3YQ20_9ARCH|nr:argininosuccinate synthase [Candidatus Diapherotrites archaeon]